MIVKLFENYNKEKEIIKDLYSRTGDDSLTDIDEMVFYLEDEYSISIDSDNLIEINYLDDKLIHIIGDNYVKLYHFAPKIYENDIKNNGLIPNIVQTNPDGNSYSGIYLTTRTSGNEIDGYKYHIRNSHKSDVILVTVKQLVKDLKEDIDDIDIASGKYQFIVDKVLQKDIVEIEDVL